MAPRLTTASVALLGAAVLAVVSTAVATDPTSVALAAAGRSGWLIPGFLSLAALACLILGLALADSRPIVPALALLGVAWLVGIPSSEAWRALTAVAGGLLLIVAELAFWSLDFKVPGRDERAILVTRGVTIATLACASVALALVPDLDVPPPTDGIELTAAGLLGATALIAVAASLAWRLRPARGPAAGSRSLERD